VAVARQQANRAAEAELALRRHQQRRAGWVEANAHLGPTYRQVVRELAWQRRAAGLAAEHEPPSYLREQLGPVPASTRGRRAWRQAAAAIADYRDRYQVTEPDRALGPAPRDPAQRVAWQHAQGLVERVHGKQRAHHDRQLADRQPSGWPRSAGDGERIDPAPSANRDRPGGRRGPERAAG
jgi:hypothetical protein